LELDWEPSISLIGNVRALHLDSTKMVIDKKNGSERVNLGFLRYEEGGPFLSFTDNNLKRRAEIGRVSKDIPISSLTMFDEKGNKIWSAP